MTSVTDRIMETVETLWIRINPVLFAGLNSLTRKVARFRLPADPQITRADQEFLPAAIEILERPGSPIAFILLRLISLFVLLALVWACLGWTDIVAVARGKIQPTGRIKLVQPVETGKVRQILAVNGSQVSEGQTLVFLEPEEALADEKGLIEGLASARAEAARRAMVIAAADTPEMTPLDIVWWEGIPSLTRQRESAVGRADLRNLAAQVMSLDAQRAQKAAERDRLANMIGAQERLIATLQERVDMRTSLLRSDSGTKASVIDATETIHTQMTVLEAERAMASLLADRAKTIATFIADNATRHNEAERQSVDLEQRLAKARVKVEHMSLRSPSDGIVQASSVTGIGQVLTAGQEVMRVVPQQGEIEIEVYIENKDIGFIHEGQDASLKIEAFPFTRYGIVAARVIRVAKDAIPEPDAKQIEGDPTRPGETRSQAGAQRVQNLVFPVTLTAEQRSIRADGNLVPLSAGMSVTAEIKTGQRRMIDYILSPIREVASEAMNER